MAYVTLPKSLKATFSTRQLSWQHPLVISGPYLNYKEDSPKFTFSSACIESPDDIFLPCFYNVCARFHTNFFYGSIQSAVPWSSVSNLRITLSFLVILCVSVKSSSSMPINPYRCTRSLETVVILNCALASEQQTTCGLRFCGLICGILHGNTPGPIVTRGCGMFAKHMCSFSSKGPLSCDIKHSAWRKTLKRVVTSSTLQDNTYAASLHGALAGEHADFLVTVFSHDNIYEAFKWCRRESSPCIMSPHLCAKTTSLN